MGKLSKVKDLVDNALDMSREARMQRAKDMGFDTDTVWYHGTTESFSAFDKKQDSDFSGVDTSTISLFIIISPA